jgi:hypothetical protein
MNGTIHVIITPMDESENCFLAPDKSLFCELNEAMPCSLGENSLTIALMREQAESKKASIARSSATNQVTSVPLSFDKRMQLLIASGLIAGITPLSVRQQWNQETLDSVSSWLDGIDVV